MTASVWFCVLLWLEGEFDVDHLKRLKVKQAFWPPSSPLNLLGPRKLSRAIRKSSQFMRIKLLLWVTKYDVSWEAIFLLVKRLGENSQLNNSKVKLSIFFPSFCAFSRAVPLWCHCHFQGGSHFWGKLRHARLQTKRNYGKNFDPVDLIKTARVVPLL